MAAGETQRELIALLSRCKVGALDTFIIAVEAEENGTEEVLIEYLKSIKDNLPDRKEIAVTAYEKATGAFPVL